MADTITQTRQVDLHGQRIEQRIVQASTALAGYIRGHWGIENRLHWVHDVDYDEDLSQVRSGNAPQVMAAIRNLAISLMRLSGFDSIAEAIRHYAAHQIAATFLVRKSLRIPPRVRMK